MNKLLNTSKCWRAVGYIIILLLSSCATRAPHYDFREIARAAVRLDMDIDKDDNHALFLEASKWIGVPYRGGGNSMRGTDCSGFTSAIYKKVYHKKLQRSAEQQRTVDSKRLSKSHLQQGDLVFFHNGRKSKKATHVGIYLKKGKFVHASSSNGVMVSGLNEDYYKKRWMQGGRVR